MGGKKRTVPDDVLQLWQRYRIDHPELTTWKATESIVDVGLGHGFSFGTIYRWIDERVRKRDNELKRIFSLQRADEKKLKRAKATARRQSMRTHARQYRILTNPTHQTELVATAYAGLNEKILSLGEIVAHIRSRLSNAPFRKSTIERILTQYISNVRGPPFLSQRADGIYEVVTGPPTPEHKDNQYR